MCGLGVGWRGFHGAPRIIMTALLKAFFVWMRRLVAAPFPLTLSLSRKGRGNPRTISSYKCKPLYAKRRPALFEARPARLKPLAEALFDPALDKVEDRGRRTELTQRGDFLR